MTTSAPLVPETTVPPSTPGYLALRLVLLVGVVVAAASPRDVEVRRVEAFPSSPAWTAPFAFSVLVVAVLAAGLGMLVMLMVGPEPRYATRWAWFWLVLYAWPVWIVYLLLEPTPAWSRRAVQVPARRLTGGWALLAAIVLGPVLMRDLTG